MKNGIPHATLLLPIGFVNTLALHARKHSITNGRSFLQSSKLHILEKRRNSSFVLWFHTRF